MCVKWHCGRYALPETPERNKQNRQRVQTTFVYHGVCVPSDGNNPNGFLMSHLSSAGNTC
eukprot:4636592-Amphidinium_carterae.1